MLGTVNVGIRHTGFLVLEVASLAADFNPAAAPVCSQMTGTYSGGERLNGQTGTWRWANSTLSLQPTSPTGPAAAAVTAPTVATPAATLAGPPPGFPTAYNFQGGGLVGFSESAAYNTLAVVNELRSSSGVETTNLSVFREHRITGGTVMCGGKAYRNAIIEDPGVPADEVSLVGIAGWGTGLLHSTSSMQVFGDLGHGPPLCSSDEGEYSIAFVAGPSIGVLSGGYTLDASGVLTFH
jgi:hypothetical protein